MRCRIKFEQCIGVCTNVFKWEIQNILVYKPLFYYAYMHQSKECSNR